MVGKTLEERAYLLRKEFPQAHITGQTLGRYYRLNNITKKKVIIQKVSNPKTLANIRKYIDENRAKLSEILAAETPIYFLDECVFSSKTFQGYDWQAPRTNLRLAQSEYNMECTAFLGAISKDKGIAYYKLYKKSVDSAKFMEYLREFKWYHGKKKCYLYMDNLAVHKTKDVRTLMEELNIHPIWAPPYSPDYNPIEFIFSKLKMLVKNMRI